MISNLAHKKPAAAPFWTAVLLLCVLLTAWCSTRIDGSSIKGDATQNLRLAYNIFHHGSFSLHASHPESHPTNFREPLPPFATAVYLKLVLPGGARNFSAWHFGEYTRIIKMGNLAWVFAGLVCVAFLAWNVARRRTAVVVALTLTTFVFFQNSVNTMYTELQTTVLLLMSALSLQLAIRSEKVWSGLIAGALLGLLSLSKSAFLVVGPSALVLLGIATLLAPRDRPNLPMRVWPKTVLPALMAFAAVTAPWMVRNQLAMGTSELSSGRAGYVMYKRALMDRMPDDTFRLAFYAYGPELYRKLVEGTSLAPIPQDRERGGRLQWLNPMHTSSFHEEDNRAIALGRPDLSFTYYRKAAATFQMIRQMLIASKHPTPDLAADQALRRAARELMAEEWWSHLKVGTLVLWRSFWWAPPLLESPVAAASNLGHPWTETLNLLSGLALFGLMAAALVARRADLLSVWALPVGMMVLHALLTQGLTRFTMPAIPFMLLALSVCLQRLLDPLWRVAKQGASNWPPKAIACVPDNPHP